MRVSFSDMGRRAGGIVDRKLKGPIPLPVHRDPCPRCGTRSDILCGHTATVLLVRAV